ncbi:MAG: tRNA (adenosine(37)-N6)-threonylcarbamoyltransferase complex transferase subunit TsaD [Candidatus Shapirobacteria bacterium]|jgi:N6-L-threonylcarbamoyladenine synthase
MIVLAIETSCDDTCAAVLENDRILSNVVSSQINLHAQWGGVVPDIAKRAHMERIMPVVMTALKRAKSLSASPLLPLTREMEKLMNEIDVIAVTVGPGLAPALGVGVNTAKELAIKYKKKLVAVNHVEGHILSNLAKNRKGKPEREIEYPALVLTVSGGHTKIILMNQNDQFSISNSQFLKNKKVPNKIGGFQYQVVGETLDDAAGEALDKAAKLMGLGYPGGPIIERLAEGGDQNFLELPRPMADKKILDYSFSGLKTSFYYKIKDWPKDKVAQNLHDLAASYQAAVFEMLLRKFKLAIEKCEPKSLMACGGVMANVTLRKQLRMLARKFKLPIFMPYTKILNTDNAGMIGVAGYFKAMRGEFVKDIEGLDRNPRAQLTIKFL